MSTPGYAGAKVKILRDINTTGGTKFRAGVVMRVSDSTSAGLTLYCTVRGYYRAVSGIPKHDVEVLEWAESQEPG